MNHAPYNRWLHIIALLTAAATFPLIFVGGLVTSHQAGLAVPDWPNSFGYNMFLFPPRLWKGGILFEHTHRLGATVVGMLSILLCAWAWVTDRRPYIRGLATAVLAGVIAQGILGGLRVVFVNLDLAIVHGCFAQAFFCLTALMALVTSRWWGEATMIQDPHPGPPPAYRGRGLMDEAAAGRRLVYAAWLVAGCVFAQLIVAAIMRHDGAGLAVPDIPFVYGHWLPPMNAAQLAEVNNLRVWKLDLPAVTLSQIWLHYAHRIGAIVVSVGILGLFAHIMLFHRNRRPLVGLASALLVLLGTQLVLGLATVYYRKPADVASLHVAVGALVLMTTFCLAVVARRLYWKETRIEQPVITHRNLTSQTSVLSPQS